MPFPPSHGPSMLSFPRHDQHRQRRARADAAEVAAQVARGQRRVEIVQSAELVELKRRLPADDAVTSRIPQQPAPQPTYTPQDGGCAECGHDQRTHERGRDTPHADGCTSTGCPCRKFRRPPWGWWDWAKFGIGVVLFAFAVLEVVVVVAGRG